MATENTLTTLKPITNQLSPFRPATTGTPQDIHDTLGMFHRVTGGSKLATVLAGHLLGRGGPAIRSIAGIHEPDITSTAPTPFPMAFHGPERAHHIRGEKELELFERMSKSIALIALRVTDIASKMRAMRVTHSTPEGRLRDMVSGRFVSKAQHQLDTEQSKYLKELTEHAFRTEQTESKQLSVIQDVKQGTEAYSDQLESIQTKTLMPLQDTTIRIEQGLTKGLSLLEKLLKNSNESTSHLEDMKRASLEEKYESKFAKRAPSLMGKGEKNLLTKAPKGAEWLTIALNRLRGLTLSLLGAVGGGLMRLGVSIGPAIMTMIVAVKDKIASFLEKSGNLLTKGKTFITEGLEGAVNSVSKAGAGIKSMLGFAKEAPVAVPPPAPLVTPPAPPVPKPLAIAGKASKTLAQKVESMTAKKAIEKVGVGVIAKTATKALPLVGFGFALKNLIQGDITQAIIDAGVGTASLIPAIGPGAAAAVGIAATLINEAYKSLYGIDPISDPHRGDRLPELAHEAASYLKEHLLPKVQPIQFNDDGSVMGPGESAAMTPPLTTPKLASMTPTEMPISAPTTGQNLTQSADMRMAQASQMHGTGKMPSIAALKTNNINSTMIQYQIASPRAAESSYLRSMDRNFAMA